MQIHIVANVHHWRQKSHLLGKFLADTAYTAQQLTILLEIDHRDQSITHFHSQRIFQLYIVPRRFDNGIILCHFYRFGFGRRFLFASAYPPGQPEQSGSEQQKYQVRHSRHQAE
ncbi:Uncharacterised protein [Shigella sonnei]|nr:Uncharacterised protein [Shigella sonnei]